MDAMDYEFLLRKVYDCDRHGANGDADADVYRKMEHAINIYEAQKKAIENKEPPVWADSLDNLEYDMRVQLSRISSKVRSALRKQIGNTYNDELKGKLEGLELRLQDRNISKELIDEIIDESLMLLKED
jgi:hypothetical protein